MKCLSNSIFLFLCAVLNYSCTGTDNADWPSYQGGDARNQSSRLDQINVSNVKKLAVAWEYHTNDAGNNSQIQCNPLIINGILYGTSPTLKVFALNAVSGEKLWEYDPAADVNFSMNANRGIAYWMHGDESRIYYTAGPLLIALNAKTGQPVTTFGQAGIASLNSGYERDVSDLFVVSTSPGVIYNDKLIIGTRVSENSDAAPGDIRAFNIHTGEVEWIFHTIPHPGEEGYETWPEGSYKYLGGANSWAGMSLDRQRGVVYCPTGSASFDFWGGNRAGKNLYANCIVALDAESGQKIWHYQTVHHDIWDRDVPAPPNLVTINHNGKTIDAVAQITKSGFVFVLNRDSGEPLFPVEEKKVPISDVEGELTWPTQPIPQKPPPFARQTFTENDITDISEKSHSYVKNIFKKVRSGNLFQPPSTAGTIIFPGFDGGGEWGGAAFEDGVLYVNSSEMPWILTLVEKSLKEVKPTMAKIGEQIYGNNCAVCHGQDRLGNPKGGFPSIINIKEKLKRTEIIDHLNSGKGFMPSFKQLSVERKEALLTFLFDEDREITHPELYREESVSSPVPFTTTGYNRFYDLNGYPAIKPPWGRLSAIDLNKGEILWQVPLGEFEELSQKGIPKTGTENYGGPVVTAGGLIFIAATQDEYIRAFAKHSGEELWKYKLPAGGYATPSVYGVNGRQYIVIACGGGKMATKSGDSYIAFALP